MIAVLLLKRFLSLVSCKAKHCRCSRKRAGKPTEVSEIKKTAKSFSPSAAYDEQECRKAIDEYLQHHKNELVHVIFDDTVE